MRLPAERPAVGVMGGPLALVGVVASVGLEPPALFGVTGVPPLVGVTGQSDDAARRAGGDAKLCGGGVAIAAPGELTERIGGDSGCGTVSRRFGFARRADMGRADGEVSAISAAVRRGGRREAKTKVHSHHSCVNDLAFSQ